LPRIDFFDGNQYFFQKRWLTHRILRGSSWTGTRPPLRCLRSLSDIFDAPNGISDSNGDIDELQEINSQILDIINTTPTIKDTTAPKSVDPIRRTLKTTGSITKTVDGKQIFISYQKEAILGSDSEAVKKQKRVRNSRAKSKADQAWTAQRVTDLETENTRLESTIANLDKELAQINRIITTHVAAQPDAATLLSSLLAADD